MEPQNTQKVEFPVINLALCTLQNIFRTCCASLQTGFTFVQRMVCPYAAKVAAYMPGFPVVKIMLRNNFFYWHLRKSLNTFSHCVNNGQFLRIFNNSKNQKSYK